MEAIKSSREAMTPISKAATARFRTLPSAYLAMARSGLQAFVKKYPATPSGCGFRATWSLFDDTRGFRGEAPGILAKTGECDAILFHSARVEYSGRQNDWLRLK
jgi:hypothetical protein